MPSKMSFKIRHRIYANMYLVGSRFFPIECDAWAVQGRSMRICEQRSPRLY